MANTSPRWLHAVVVLCFVVCSGCARGDRERSTPEPSAVTLSCQGGSAIVSAITSFPRGTIFEGEHVLYDNGIYFLYVDASCRYWTHWQAARGEVRTGTLSQDALAQLGAELAFGRWPEWAGHWVPEAVTFDGAIVTLYPNFEREAAVSCVGFCEGPPIPPELAAAYRQVGSFIRSLWDSGSPLDGDMRMTAVRLGDEGRFATPVFQWPATSFSLSDVAVSPTDDPPLQYGQGRLVTGNDASLIRVLRAEYLVRAAHIYPSIEVIDEDGARYSVYARDVLPFENEFGLVRPQ